MQKLLTAVLSRLRLLDTARAARTLLRSSVAATRERTWRRHLNRSTGTSRYEVKRVRSRVWVCESRASIDPVQTFAEAFQHCLAGSTHLTPADFGILVREGGRYPAIEMTPQAWAALVRRWRGGDAPWNLHVQLSSHRTRPECLRVVSQRTGGQIERWTDKVIVFVAVSHPSSPLPVERRLGVDIYVRKQIDPRREQEPWGELELATWVRELRRPPFPIDAVYTWVDDSDPRWLQRRSEAAPDASGTIADSVSADRFANRDELRYSLRSLALFAEWFDRVCVVTDQQTPSWAAQSLEIVDHRDILADDALPTFNSHAIETGLHRIPNLSEHYIYLNDDVFFDGPVPWSLFFTADGSSRFFLSQAIIPDAGREEKSIDYATSNGRSLLQRELGFFVSQKMKHTPQTQRRSVHLWMESEFAREHRSTSRAQFRSVDDQSFASFLHHYVGFVLGKSEPGRNLRYDYFNAADGRLADRLAFLTDRPGLFDTYCINDAEASEAAQSQIDSQIRHHLMTSLPFPTSWEAGADGATS